MKNIKTLWKHLKTWKLIALVIDDNGRSFITCYELPVAS